MTVKRLAQRWCVVEQEQQQDLFVTDPWHTHMVEINMRLDNPVERTLCGDLLPARPVYRELLRAMLPNLCPQCLALTSLRKGVKGASQRRSPALPQAIEEEPGAVSLQRDLAEQGWL